MISDPKFITAKEWFEKLRDNLVENGLDLKTLNKMKKFI